VPRLRARVLTALLVGVLLVTGLPSAGGALDRRTVGGRVDLGGCTGNRVYEVCFTDPVRTPGSALIINRIRAFAKRAGRGDTIRVAVFNWVERPLAKDLVAARQRGANVRVVLDDKSRGEPAHRVLRRGGVTVDICVNSCLAPGGHIMHNKFFLFELNGVRTVIQSSANISYGQRQRFQNSLRVTGDQRLWNTYYGYFKRLRAARWLGWSEAERDRPGSGAVKAYLYPRSDDNLLEILANVEACRTTDAKVWLTQSQFEVGRDALRRRLNELRRDSGCSVRLIVQKAEAERYVQRRARGANLPDGTVRRAGVHDKIIVVDARYNGRWRELVFTGSHNLVRSSVVGNDEVLLKVWSPLVFEAHLRRFRGLFERSCDGARITAYC
jgi:phosphatidylserine/phosphatidylglycerophosphate/cardiolipin synthase-like enzyme